MIQVLGHPNIISIYGFRTDAEIKDNTGIPRTCNLLSMECANRMNLFEILMWTKIKPLDEKALRHYFR